MNTDGLNQASTAFQAPKIYIEILEHGGAETDFLYTSGQADA